MIIKRKYVQFRKLCDTDPKARDIIFEAYNMADMDEAEKNRIMEYNQFGCVFDRVMGCGIPNLFYIKEKFDELDQSDPYDNKFDYSDVRDIDIIMKDEDYIHYLLVTSFGEIVQSVEHSIEKK